MDRFALSSLGYEPAYAALQRRGELARRARQALAGLEHCAFCPRRCGANRLAGETGVCRAGARVRVASYFSHMGEEDCLRGRHGSGTIFFAHCNLRCVFCQNYETSHLAEGVDVEIERLAAMMLELQEHGCHNINLVTPSHVVPQIIGAVALAAEAGLRLPIVYNTSAYDSLETLRLLEDIVDIYMPDFKMWNSEHARRYLTAADYPDVARQALLEMHRQVGDLMLDEYGVARRGLLVRQLVMPGNVADSDAILRFLAEAVSPHTYVNVMAQYHPSGEVSARRFAEINRPLTRAEFAAASQLAGELGLRLDSRRW